MVSRTRARMFQPPRLVPASIGVAALLIVAGCGSDDPPAASTSSASPTIAGSTPLPTTGSTPGSTPPQAGPAPAAATDRYPGARGWCVALAPSQVDAALGGKAKLDEDDDADDDDCDAEFGDSEVTVEGGTLSGNDSYGPDVAAFRAYHESHSEYRAVPGIGEAAYLEIDEADDDDDSIRVAKGDQYLIIEFDPEPDWNAQRTRSVLIALATTAVERMPIPAR